MKIVYTGEPVPAVVNKSIFLAGPSPRKSSDPSWRLEAFDILGLLGYDGVVYAPIYRDQDRYDNGGAFDYEGQVDWESDCLNQADCIVFWVPRDIKGGMPAFTTNVEFGTWATSGKVVFGAPPNADKNAYLQNLAGKEGIPEFDTLEETLEAAVARLGGGSPRSGGERDVPLHLWNKPEFQTWLTAQKSVGNVLNSASVSWSFRVGKYKERVFLWALHVNVHIKAEGRNKTNEVVVFRPDISTIVAYCPPSNDQTDMNYLLNTEVVLVSEFRSPANNPTAMVTEVPGGSSFKPGSDPQATASEEMHEETGLKVEWRRFKQVGTRQVAATLAAHRAHCYAVQLTPHEIAKLKDEAGKAHGNHEDTEYTFVTVTTLADLLKNSNVDWSNLGMIFQALSRS